jgi:hypothetical protein
LSNGNNTLIEKPSLSGGEKSQGTDSNDDFELKNKYAAAKKKLESKKEDSSPARPKETDRASKPGPKPAPAAPAPVVAVVDPVVPVPGFCEVLRANRERVYFNPNTSEEACRLTCESLDATNPYRECSYNGIIFRQTPTAQCLIVGSGGKVHFNAMLQPQPCKDQCASLESTNPLRTCVWDGQTFRAP